MSRIVQHYDPWKTESAGCQKCGWCGAGVQLVQGELFSELYEMECPACGEVVLVVSLPTIEEANAHRDEMPPLERELFDKRNEFFSKHERGQLRDPAQLPDIPGAEEIVLEWDMHWDVPDAFSRTNRIKWGEQILWEELALYESYERFAEIAKILKQKYGARFVDLVPTDRSKTYLWGDRLSAPESTDGTRRWLRTGNPDDLPRNLRDADAP